MNLGIISLKKLFSIFCVFTLLTIGILGFTTLSADAFPPPVMLGDATVNGNSGEATPITTLNVSTVASFSVDVEIYVDEGTLAFGTTTGLTFTGSGENSGSTVSFSGIVEDVNAALDTLTYTRAGTGTNTIVAQMSEPGMRYNPTNSHLYQMKATGNNWSQAQSAAAGFTTEGQPGYIATITSATENDFIKNNFSEYLWIGANDTASEGDWQWKVGPEANTAFWSGLEATNGGTVVGGEYSNWESTEPNNYGNSEDCAVFNPSNGGWQDWGCNIPVGYIVEYGDGITPLAAISSASVVVNTEANIHEITSCAELQTIGENVDLYADTYLLANDINCSGIDFAPIYWDQKFQGTFDGQGHKIFNLTINKPSDTFVGLFISSSGATISNVDFVGGDVSGYLQVGTVIGEATNTSLYYVNSSANVSAGGDFAGGLVGNIQADSGVVVYIDHSSSSGAIEGLSNTGGLIGNGVAQGSGNNEGIVIQYSYFTGSVHSESGSGIGGIVGSVQSNASNGEASFTIQDSFVSGDVYAPDSENVGGITGIVQMTSVVDGPNSIFDLDNTYASGNVTGVARVGGLVGYAGENTLPNKLASYTNSFAVGQVSGNDPDTTGALFGMQESDVYPLTFSNLYYDAETTTQNDCMGYFDISADCNVINQSDIPNYYYNPPSAVFSDWDFQGDPWHEHEFTYPTLVIDDDYDGVTTPVEDSAPNGGDGNDDNIADSEQENVVSGLNCVNNDYYTISVASENTLLDVVCFNNDDLPTPDDTHTYPYGLALFKVVTNPGDDVLVTITYHSTHDIKNSSVVKFDRNTGNFNEIPGATIEATSDQVVVSYTISEGGLFDEDGTENGILIDPAGLAISPAAMPTTQVIAPRSSAQGSLPSTGSNAFDAVLYGLTLGTLGAGLFMFAKKRKLLRTNK